MLVHWKMREKEMTKGRTRGEEGELKRKEEKKKIKNTFFPMILLVGHFRPVLKNSIQWLKWLI